MGSTKEPYAKVDVSYLTGFAPPMRGLSLGARVVYLGLWGLCRLHRRQTIEIHGYPKYSDLAADLHVDPRTCASGIAELVTKSLIYVADMQHKGRKFVGIFVVGFRLKHEKLQIEDDFEGGSTSHHITSQIKEHRATPVSEKQSKEPEKPKRSIRQADQDRDIEDLRAAYSARFPNAPPLVESELGEILKGCRLRELSPTGLLEQVKPHVQKPMGMIRGYLRGEYRIRDDIPSWYSWCIRHNGDMKHISELLPGKAV